MTEEEKNIDSQTGPQEAEEAIPLDEKIPEEGQGPVPGDEAIKEIVLEQAEGQEEDILFPLEEDASPTAKGPMAKLIRGLLVLFLFGLVFLMGYGTQPEVFNRWVEDVEGWFHVGVEKAKPIGKEMYEKTVEVVDKIHGPKEGPNRKLEGGDVQAGRKIKYWRAPMNPNYTSDRPGKSPMGMDLIPVYEDENGDGVSVSPVMVQNIGVKTERAVKKSLSREIRTVARLTYDERLVNHIHTKYGGWIDKLYVDFTGQEVGKDDVLLEIYSPNLVSTQEELILALKYQESLKESPFPEISRGAKGLVDSTLKRLELFDVPQHQIDELIQSKKVTKTLHIHSPVKGFVIKKHVQQGMHVKPGMNLYMIADLSNIWVLADIYEYEMPWVKLGQEAEMTLSYFPGKTFKGKVTFIDPFLDPDSRTLKVRMEFPNPNWKLKPEMYANVVLKEEISEKAVVIPEEAVIYTGEKTIVIIQKASGGFESREVNLGVAAEGYVQVLEGVKGGEHVVTSSTFLIDSESRLKEALEKLGGPSVKLKPSVQEPKKKSMPDHSKEMGQKSIILLKEDKNESHQH